MATTERALDAPGVRPLAIADLADYKQLRDEMLLAHPTAFTSDAAAESAREPADYLQRLGLDRPDGGHFLLGAWLGERLVGAIGCERDARLKVRHIGHLAGMMVRPDERERGIGGMLVEACIAACRQTAGLELLTLNVTTSNRPAIALYRRFGFTVYGSLPHALKLGRSYHDKQQMLLVL